MSAFFLGVAIACAVMLAGSVLSIALRGANNTAPGSFFVPLLAGFFAIFLAIVISSNSDFNSACADAGGIVQRVDGTDICWKKTERIEVK